MRRPGAQTVTDREALKAARVVLSGKSIAAAADEIGATRASLYRAWRRLGIEPETRIHLVRDGVDLHVDDVDQLQK